MKKVFIILVILALAAPLWAGESEDLATQYGKMKALQTYYEAKVEKLVIGMNILEQRFAQIKKQQSKEKKEDAKKPVKNPANSNK
jgi:hypothetical protein